MDDRYQIEHGDSVLTLRANRRAMYLAIASRVVNSDTRALVDGVVFTSDECDYLGSEAIAWVRKRFDLVIDPDQSGYALVPRATRS